MSDWTPERPGPSPDRKELETLFADLHWHQRWEIFDGVFTPGRNPVDDLCNHVRLPRDLRGKRVLDIGAWHGCFSFECERRGADEVVALSAEPVEQVGFERIRDAIGSRVVRYEEGSVYSLDPKKLGKFDLVLFLGVLYHLRYPILAIDRLYQITTGPVLVETHVIDNCVFRRGQTDADARALSDMAPKLADVPLWQFYSKDELGKDSSNWFGPNIAAVDAAFSSAGFSVEQLDTWGTRAAFRATPNQSAEYLEAHSYETSYKAVRDSIKPAGTSDRD